MPDRSDRTSSALSGGLAGHESRSPLADQQEEDRPGEAGTIVKLLSVLISLALGVVAMEAFLYLMPRFQATNAPVERIFCKGGPNYVMPSARFGTIEMPGAIFFERRNEAEPWALHFVNDLGFRDLYDEGDVGVIVLGDSFARGTLVSNHETFADLLDRWQPDIAFHNFGIGGFGTADAYRVYREVADEVPHRLVVLAYYVGNDVENNLESDYALEDGALIYHEPVPGAGADPQDHSLLFDAHVFLSNTLRSYRLVYQTIRQQFEHAAMSSDEADALFETGIDLTRALLTRFADSALDHDADLLITILPAWNDGIHYIVDAARNDQQRAMIQALAKDRQGVFAIDLAAEMGNLPREKIFGRVDKHFNDLGQYATAAAIAGWLKSDWKNADVQIRPVSPYAPPVEIEPDCGLVEDYRERVLTPPGSQRAS
jgi:hypothetical protein